MPATITGRRHSSLKQITSTTQARLVPKWIYHVPEANGLRTNPIVYDGIMYVTNSNEVRALDARTGRLIWEYKDTQPKKKAVNRGAAILGDPVFFVTGDVHLVALDRRNGSRCCGRSSTGTSKTACTRHPRRSP